jgi:hypothetical protein
MEPYCGQRITSMFAYVSTSRNRNTVNSKAARAGIAIPPRPLFKTSCYSLG